MKKLYIFIGPPGCGKGTQAEFLRDNYNLNAFSAGELLRSEAAKPTAQGKVLAPIVSSGRMVPDELIAKIMLKKLAGSRRDVIFDGFPRTMAQVEIILLYLKPHKIKTTAVIFDLPDTAVLARITGRRTCEKCGAIYHLKFNSSKKKGICDQCGGKLFQRNDAKAAVVKNRLKVYHTQTKPVVDFYKRNKRYKFCKINSLGSIEKTRKQLLTALGL